MLVKQVIVVHEVNAALDRFVKTTPAPLVATIAIAALEKPAPAVSAKQALPYTTEPTVGQMEPTQKTVENTATPPAKRLRPKAVPTGSNQAAAPPTKRDVI